MTKRQRIYLYNASGKGIDIIFYSKIFWKCIEQVSSSILKRTIFHEIDRGFSKFKIHL